MGHLVAGLFVENWPVVTLGVIYVVMNVPIMETYDSVVNYFGGKAHIIIHWQISSKYLIPHVNYNNTLK